MDHWLEYSNLLVNGPALEATCQRVNDYLAPRMYLSDHRPTAADVVCWAQLAGKISAPARLILQPCMTSWHDLLGTAGRQGICVYNAAQRAFCSIVGIRKGLWLQKGLKGGSTYDLIGEAIVLDVQAHRFEDLHKSCHCMAFIAPQCRPE